MDSIENLGDAHEALEECFKIILDLTGGDKLKINAVCHKINATKIAINLRHG